jgi:L-ascorbate metabolism protein UlaG (beta-lactamase superfamily)
MQAAIAARLLHAKQLCPMHYDTFNNPPYYIEQPNPILALKEAAGKESVKVCILQPGESIELN